IQSQAGGKEALLHNLRCVCFRLRHPQCEAVDVVALLFHQRLKGKCVPGLGLRAKIASGRHCFVPDVSVLVHRIWSYRIVSATDRAAASNLRRSRPVLAVYQFAMNPSIAMPRYGLCLDTAFIRASPSRPWLTTVT